MQDTLRYYAQRTDEESIKSVDAKIVNAKKDIEEMTNSFIQAKSQLLRDNIEKKMLEFEVLLDNLLMQKAKLEIERGFNIGEQDLLKFIKEILSGDPTKEDYKNQS
ncbi:MAG: hypothetical protein LBE09_00320 [Christensenellaceae bacterium]|nr:hypothetical protein [Christensenellaceae bacterium]